MKKSTLAIVVGIIIGGLFIALGDTLSLYMFPSAVPIPTDQRLLAYYMENDVPFGAQLIVVVNWVIAACVASVTSSLISGRTSAKPMLAAVGVLNVLTLFQLLIRQHPKWMLISSFALFIPVGYIIYLLIRKKHTNEEA